MVDGHAHATLARGASHGGHRPAVPRSFQSFPIQEDDHLLTVLRTGAKPLAGEYGRSGRGLAMVESLASRTRQQGGTFGRRPAGPAETLATPRSDTANRSGVGGVAAFGGAGFSLRRGVVAGANGEAIGFAIHFTPSRSALAKTTKIKTPLLPFFTSLPGLDTRAVMGDPFTSFCSR